MKGFKHTFNDKTNETKVDKNHNKNYKTLSSLTLTNSWMRWSHSTQYGTAGNIYPSGAHGPEVAELWLNLKVRFAVADTL